MNHYAAHELLETQESLRTKAAHIELYGVLFDMASDAHLKDILQNQQRRMLQDYQQGMMLMSGRGMQIVPHTPHLRTYENLSVGINQPQQMMPPNPNQNRLSDSTIATVILNLHKSGSSICMLWATECVDPQIRTYHATCANVCQEMAYEIWQYLNYTGYYQPPELSDKTMNTMMQSYQAMGGSQPSQSQMMNAQQPSQSQMINAQQPSQSQMINEQQQFAGYPSIGMQNRTQQHYSASTQYQKNPMNANFNSRLYQ